MAVVFTNIGTVKDTNAHIDQNLATLIQSTEASMQSDADLFATSNKQVASYSSTTNSRVAGIYAEGNGSFEITGSNLLADAAVTVTSITDSNSVGSRASFFNGSITDGVGVLTEGEYDSTRTGYNIALDLVGSYNASTPVANTTDLDVEIIGALLDENLTSSNARMLFEVDGDLNQRDVNSFGNLIGTASDIDVTLFPDTVQTDVAQAQYIRLGGISVDYELVKNGNLFSSLLLTLLNGDDVITGDTTDDQLNGYGGNDTIDGGAGNDTAVFSYARSEVNSISVNNGSVIIDGVDGVDTLTNIERFLFTDTSTALTLSQALTWPNLGQIFTKIGENGEAIQIAPTPYEGAVSYLEFELLGEGGNDTVTGSAFNDFMNLLGGDDAAVGGDGKDVLDGGTGSNFLTGGNGADTFFLDGRGGDTTWSTIADFNGDSVNIWGWSDGVSKLLLTQGVAGAEGYQGVTFHYDLNDDGSIDTSITFTGLTEDQVPTGSAQVVADNGYLLFA